MQLAKPDPFHRLFHRRDPFHRRFHRRARRCVALLFPTLVATAFLISPCSGGEFRLSEVGKIDLPINARAIAWHPDSKSIAAGGFAGMLTVWDAHSGRLIRDLKQTNGVVESVEFSSDRKFLAVGKSVVRRGAYLTIFDAATYGVIDERESPNVKNGKNSPGLHSISVDPKTSRKIAVLGYENSWDPVIFSVGPMNREIVSTPPKARDYVQKVVFSPNGEILAVGYINGLVVLYSSEDGRPLKSFAAYDKWWIRGLVFSPDGRFLYTGSNTGFRHEYLDKATGQWRKRQNNEPIKMWDMRTLKLVRIFDPEGVGIESLAVSPDGRYLYAGLIKRLKIWEVATGALVKQIDTSGALLVKPSANGKYLATTDTGTRVIRIWSVAN